MLNKNHFAKFLIQKTKNIIQFPNLIMVYLEFSASFPILLNIRLKKTSIFL